MLSLKEKLIGDMKAAMKAKDEGKLRLTVIRMARAAIKNAEIDKKHDFDDAEVIDILAREVKMRRDAIPEFEKGNRPDAVAKLKEEIEILLDYLPQQLGAEEIRELAAQVIADVGAYGPKDLGKVMGALTPKTKGRTDGKLVNQIVRELLGT